MHHTAILPNQTRAHKQNKKIQDTFIDIKHDCLCFKHVLYLMMMENMGDHIDYFQHDLCSSNKRCPKPPPHLRGQINTI